MRERRARKEGKGRRTSSQNIHRVQLRLDHCTHVGRGGRRGGYGGRDVGDVHVMFLEFSVRAMGVSVSSEKGNK